MPGARAPAISPALWPAVSAAFDTVLALPAAERDAWLADWQRQHPSAFEPLSQLLQQHARADEPPAPTHALLAAALVRPRAPARAFQPGQRIGIYELVRPLGQGGMAQVWLAVQHSGVHREVALKLPHAGLEEPAATAQRFERERDMLAVLEHPHIARLYDAGVADGGQPFLAMERVHGRPITDHAQGMGLGLGLPARLALFAQVLAAVGYAHGRMVIHRDLKPSNILVTPEGQAKLLDFGIAQLLHQAAAADDGVEPQAARGSRAITPDFAPPEQLAGGVLSAGADVYALGVVLYELLTGRRPYRLDPTAPVPLVQQLAALRWPAPSAVAATAAARRALRGDLDAIVAKAMALDAAHRYASIDALATDLQRHAAHEPLAARGNGLRYRLAVALRRHRVGVLAAGTTLAALAVGLVLALWQAQQARLQAQRADAVKAFLVDVFAAADPRQLSTRPRGQTTARELLDRGAARLDEQGVPDLPLRVELLGLLGTIYGYLGEDERFSAMLLQQRNLAEAHYGPAHPVVIDALFTDVHADIYSRHYAAAQATLARLDGLIQQAGLDDSVRRAEWWHARSEALRATPNAAAERLELLGQATRLLERLAPTSELYTAALANAGQVQVSRENWPAALALFEQALAVPLAAGQSQENLPMIRIAMGRTLAEIGRLDAALAQFEQAEAVALQGAGPGFLAHDLAVAAKARLLQRLGRRDEALALLAGLRLAATPEAEPRTPRAREDEAAALLAEGRAEPAAAMLRVLLRAAIASPRLESDVRRLQGLLGEALLLPGPAQRLDEARTLLQAALAASRERDADGSAARALAQARWQRVASAAPR